MKDLLRWSLLPLAFVPLVTDATTLFPFIFPKTFLIRTVVALFWTLFAVWLFTDRKRISTTLQAKWHIVKNPVFLFTIGFFIVLMALSTVFAVNPYRAFFGDIERGEGLLGTFSFIGFFVATLLVFEKKDWMNFFKLTLITGVILFIHSINELSEGFVRAQSQAGNPTFLAAVFLFVMFAALVLTFSKESKFWQYVGASMIPVGVIGVFLTGTRGAILGLLVGTVLVVTYFAVKGQNVTISIPYLSRKVNLRKLSIGLIIIGLLFGVGFFTTRSNPVWQSVPGLGRFTDLSLDDATLQTRLISAGVSIESVKPQNGGLMRLLIGYGPENFNVAYNKYYDPEYMRYEPLWFDRAHNRVFDVLVMNGLVGLIAYLGIWVSLLFLAFRRVKEKGYAAAILFFSAAYFVQNLFVFDQISTYIPFLSLFAFTIFVSSYPASDNEIQKDVKRSARELFAFGSVAFAIFLAVTLTLYTFVPYKQSRVFIRALQAPTPELASANSDQFLEPYNYTQEMIRNRYLRLLGPYFRNPQYVGLAEGALQAQEEYVTREPYDPRDILLLANTYRFRATLGQPQYFDVAERYYRQALELSPTRQEHLYSIAITHAIQGELDEMQVYLDAMREQSWTVPRTRLLYGTAVFQVGESRFEESMEVIYSAMEEPNIFFNPGELASLRHMHQQFLPYFFEQRDNEQFRNAIEGALLVELLIEKGESGLLDPASVAGLDPAVPDLFRDMLRRFDEGGFAGVNLEPT